MKSSVMKENLRYAFAGALIILILWTLSTKYMVPIIWAASQNIPWNHKVMWDAWPLTHAVLVWGLWMKTKWIWLFGLIISLAEIGVAGTKLLFYLFRFSSDIFDLSWFFNKIIVLILFISLTSYLLICRRHFQDAHL